MYWLDTNLFEVEVSVMAGYITKRIEPDLKNCPKRIALDNWLREQREAKDLTMRDLRSISGKPHSFFGKIKQAQRGGLMCWSS